MFYTYAEKQGNAFFDGWQMRQVTFDTMRRYLYYSTATLTHDQIVVPMDNDFTDTAYDGLDTPNSLGVRQSSPAVTHSTPVSATRANGGLSPLTDFEAAPTQPNQPGDVTWRKKMKVDYIEIVSKNHRFDLADPHLREMDMFQVEVYGETRVLQTHEAPAPGPMLTPSSGWGGLPGRFVPENNEYVADPYFLRELYKALRDQFANLKLERERLEATTGVKRDPRLVKVQTLNSPRGKNESLVKGNRVKVIFRLRSEYEFRRFWFVVQSVLGYDKLGVRPYRGLPPYDPRNGISFAHIPMRVWHTFKVLEKAVIYTFVRGDLVGRTSEGDLTIFVRGAYLCITHEMIMVFRDTGTIARWVRMQDVRCFECNSTCPKPYVAFLTDRGIPDIVFIPQPPVFGPDAIRRFNPKLEVLRVRLVVRESCLASVETRRVIQIAEASERAVRPFILRVEAENERPMNFDPASDNGGPISCPLPQEQLASVWRDVQEIFANRDPVAISQAAIPIYSNNANDTALTAGQLQVLERRLERERESSYDIVGMPIAEARQINPLLYLQRRRRTASQDGPRRTGAGLRRTSTAHPGGVAHDHSGGGGGSADASGGLRRCRTAADGGIARMRAGEDSSSRRASAGSNHNYGLSRDGNVALPEERLQTLQLHPVRSRPDIAEFSTVRTPDGSLGNYGIDAGAIENASFVSDYGTDGSFCTSLQYAVPGSRYLTSDEIAAGVGGASPTRFVPDQHTIIMGQTPASPSAQGRLPGSSVSHSPVFCMSSGPAAGIPPAVSMGHSGEMNVDELMSHSFAFMRSTAAAPSDAPQPPLGTRTHRGSISRDVNSWVDPIGGSRTNIYPVDKKGPSGNTIET